MGSGQQRYKFLEEDGISNSSTKRLAIRSTSSPSSQSGRSSQSLSRTPSSNDTLLSNALIAKLKAKDDIRYHLPWAYGSFLEAIPQRIGTNEALDTAVDALVYAHSQYGTTTRGAANDPKSLTRYTHAVTTLRLCLDDPVKARETNTLAAVMLLLICQSFLGTYVGEFSGHTEGAAIILKTRGYGNPEDDFERNLILTLRGPVLFESLYNSRIQFSHEEWTRLVKNPLDGELPKGNVVYCLAHVPELMRRGRIALSTNSSTQGLIYEARHQYNKVKASVDKLREAYETSKAPSSPQATRLHAHHQRMFGLGLAIILIFHSLLQALGDNSFDLCFDSQRCCEDVLDLAEHARPFRPLGSSYVLLCLTTAWVATTDEVVRELLLQTYEDYQEDFPHPSNKNLSRCLDSTRDRLHLLRE